MDDVGHLSQELLGLVQQLQDVAGVKRLCGGTDVSRSGGLTFDPWCPTCCSLNALRRALVSETERGNDSLGPVYDSGTETRS